MERAEATRRLEAVLGVLAAGTGEVVPLVSEFHVFGSYARGALEVGDIDVDVEYEVDQERAWLEYARMSSGRSPTADLRQELFGRQRIFRAHFNARIQLQDELGGFVLLWRRGDTLAHALECLHAIAEDPKAGTAERDPVVAELADVVHWIARPIRNELSAAVREGTITLERRTLEDAGPRGRRARASIKDRWGEANPHRRAALAAAAFLERSGVRGVSAYGARWGALSAAHGRVAVGLTTGHFLHALDFLREARGRLWLQVLNPSRRAPLEAVLIRPQEARRDGSS